VSAKFVTNIFEAIKSFIHKVVDKKNEKKTKSLSPDSRNSSSMNSKPNIKDAKIGIQKKEKTKNTGGCC
jgi:hypothetical protein